MDPLEYIALARQIAGLGRAGARCATSRAYYAAFQANVRKLMAVRNIPT